MTQARISKALIASHAGLQMDAVWEMFSTGFDPTQSESMSIRALQLREILGSWADNPLLGSGHGAFLRNHIRDLSRPWAYEQSYAALLFQTGVVGCLSYGLLMLWLYGCVIAIIRRGGAHAWTMIPIAVGLTAFLVANATNPYLQKFDFMWVVFLPLALVNAWLIEVSAKVRDQNGYSRPAERPEARMSRDRAASPPSG